MTGRAAVLGRGLLARAGVGRALCLWPSVRTPMLIAGAADRHAGRWMERTFGLAPPRRLRPDAATLNVLRADGLIVDPAPSPLLAAVERALGRPLHDPRPAFHTTGGAHPKVLCFVFEGRAREPVAVAKALTHASDATGIEREVARLEAVRARLAGSPLADDLPPAALWVGPVEDSQVVVEPIDGIAVLTGNVERGPALDWLLRFQVHTRESERGWDDADLDATLAVVRRSWELRRPGGSPGLCAAVERVGRALLGAPVPRAGLHGDYWSGNLAGDDRTIRVFDWEFAEFGQPPFFDLWTWELADLRGAALRGQTTDFDGDVRAATARVRAELGRRGVDERFALISLPHAIGHLTYRMQLEHGYETGNERSSAVVMDAVERFVAASA